MRTRFLFGAALITVSLQTSPSPAYALPPGRAWAPVDTLHEGIHFLAAPRLQTMKGDRLRLVASGITAPRSILAYQWSDSLWEMDARLDYGANFIWPVLSDEDEEHVVWKGIVPVGPFGNDTYLLYLQTLPNLQGHADTLALSHGSSWEYSGATTPSMRWVLHDDFGNLRLFRSRRPGPWVEVAMPGNGSNGTTIAALNDTTALAAWAEHDLIQSAIIRGDDVQLIPIPQNTEKEIPGRPKLRRRPSGGFWLTWSLGGRYIKLSSFDGTSWSGYQPIECGYHSSRPLSYIADSPDVSQDAFERPVIAWSAYGADGREVICVTCPTDSGYPMAEEIPVSNGGFLASPARDENGDVWLAWWKYYDGAFWTHSYTSVGIVEASVSPSNRGPRVRWTLEGEAPESWWSVLRSGGDSPYEVVGRVRAGATTQVEWTDTTATPGSYLYRVRRDCKDRRFELLSDALPATVDTGNVTEPFRLRLGGAHPFRGTARLRATGAAPGVLTIELFDVRGRLVLSTKANVGSDGTALIDVGSERLGSDAAGLYFARARDSRGRSSETLKVVRL